MRQVCSRGSAVGASHRELAPADWDVSGTGAVFAGSAARGEKTTLVSRPWELNGFRSDEQLHHGEGSSSLGEGLLESVDELSTHGQGWCEELRFSLGYPSSDDLADRLETDEASAAHPAGRAGSGTVKQQSRTTEY